MLRKALSRLEAQKGLTFIADKAYDSVDIIQTLLDKGLEPVAIYFLPYPLPLCFNLFLRYSVDFSNSLLKS
jgi:hypothetical protein